MRIIKSELKKIFKNKVIFIALIVFLLLNITNIYRNYNIHNGIDDNIVAGQLFLREHLDGKITNYKIALINQEIDKLKILKNDEKYIYQENPEEDFITGYVVWDLQLWESYKYYIDNAQYYAEQIKDKTDKALKNAEFYSGRNSFYEKENKLYYNSYINREITSFYDSNGFANYFEYSFSSILTVIMLLLGVIPIFCNECESDMDIILVTSKNGRRKTVFAKILSALVYTFIVESVFSICDFVFFMLFQKPDGLIQSLYAVEGFSMCSTDILVWHFCIILFVLRLLGMFVICLLFLLFSRLFRHSVAPFVLGASVFFIFMSAKTFLTNSAGNIINLFNPISLLTSYNYYKTFYVIDFFGYPLFTYWAVAIIGILIIIILSALIAFIPLKLQIKLPKIQFGRRKRLCV